MSRLRRCIIWISYFKLSQIVCVYACVYIKLHKNRYIHMQSQVLDSVWQRIGSSFIIYILLSLFFLTVNFLVVTWLDTEWDFDKRAVGNQFTLKNNYQLFIVTHVRNLRELILCVCVCFVREAVFIFFSPSTFGE